PTRALGLLRPPAAINGQRKSRSSYFSRRMRRRCPLEWKTVPQRLKPNSLQSICVRRDARGGEVGRTLQEMSFPQPANLMKANRKGNYTARKDRGPLLRFGFYPIALLLMLSASLFSLGETQADSFERVSIGAFDPDAWNGIVF